MMSLQEQYFQACLDRKPEATTTTFNDCQGKCPADANKDICREVCHLVTHCVTPCHTLSHKITIVHSHQSDTLQHQYFQACTLTVLESCVDGCDATHTTETAKKTCEQVCHLVTLVLLFTVHPQKIIIIDGILYNANIFRGLALLPARLIAPL